jgi:quaternary ammonium compound-resistance protein SugE
MNWAILVVAGIFEVGWAIGLKYTEGFNRLWPSVWTVLAMIISLGLPGIAMKALPVGTAYCVWVGVGAIGTVVLGIVLFGAGEPGRARVNGQLMLTVRLESRWRRARFGGKMYLASHVERPGSNWVGEDR